MNQSLDKGHLLSSIFHDDRGVLGGAAQEVRGEHHGQVGGVHLSDGHDVGGGKHLKEPDEEGDDEFVEVG